MNEAIFLGTGTSGGVPVIGCRCEVCQSADKKDKRWRSSLYLRSKNVDLVIDTGPDFRTQILENGIERLDAALITHTHKDHIAGLDDAKSFSVINQKAFPIFADKHSIEVIEAEFSYAFQSFRYPGIPEFKLREVGEKPFFVDDLEIVPVPVMHYRLPILGYRVGTLAYITDANAIPADSLTLLQDLDVLVINALRTKPHIAHFTLQEALEMIEAVKPRRAFLTHVSHQLGLHEEVSKTLPENVFLAYDRLKISW